MHPLHTQKFIDLCIANTGYHPGLRRTGRTTRAALLLLAAALDKPRVPIKAADHHGTTNANLHLLYVAREMASKLSLTGLVFNPGALTVTFG